MQENFTQRDIDFICKFVPLESEELNPVLFTIFTRFTLIGLNKRERITFDINPEFEGYSHKTELPFLVICEVKQDRMLPAGYFLNLLRSHRIFPSNLSKYSIGTVILNPAVKQNLFKSKLLTINKIKNDSGSHNIAS